MGSPVAVAVTGGIGSGKTEACRQFASLGAMVLSADAIARQLSESNPAVRRGIRAAFGAAAFRPNGTLERRKIAERVFGDPRALRKLNGIVHPHVHRYLRAQIASARKKAQVPMIVVEAALIYESGAETLFDFVIVIAADREECIRRIMSRDGMSHRDVLLRMGSQLPEEMKMRKADFIIRNSGSKEELMSNCKFLYRLLTSWKSVRTT